MVVFKKKIKIAIAVLLLAIVCAIIFSIIVDPYSIYHYDSIRVHSGLPNSRYVKIKYIENNANKFNSFIFGSSRVGYIHMDQINDKENKWYNMTYPNGGVEDSLYSLETLINKGVIPKNVMVGIDGVDESNPFRFDGDLLRTQYPDNIWQNISFHLAYLNPSVSAEALFTLDWESGDEVKQIREQYYEKGYEDIIGEPNFHYNLNRLVPTIPKIDIDDHMKDSVSVVKKLVDLCDAYNINLILFMNPIHYSIYANEVGRGYILYVREIAKLHDIYNFAGVNDICFDDKNYWEEVHFTKEVGDKIIKVIFDNEKIDDFGLLYLITKENADIYFENALNEYCRAFDITTY